MRLTVLLTAFCFLLVLPGCTKSDALGEVTKLSAELADVSVQIDKIKADVLKGNTDAVKEYNRLDERAKQIKQKFSDTEMQMGFFEKNDAKKIYYAAIDQFEAATKEIKDKLTK